MNKNPEYVDESEKKLQDGWNFGGKGDRAKRKNRFVPFPYVTFW